MLPNLPRTVAARFRACGRSFARRRVCYNRPEEGGCRAGVARPALRRMGGLLSVLDGDVRLVATTWEWAEDIDQARAEASKKRAEEILARKNLNDREYELAQARLKRALVRTSVH